MNRQPQGEKTVFIVNLSREKKSAIENNAHKTPTQISLHILKDFFYKTERHLEFLSIKGGCPGSSKSTLVKISALQEVRSVLLYWQMHLIHLFLGGSFN